MIIADTSQLARLADELLHGAAVAGAAIEAAMHRGANNIVRDARELAPKKRVRAYASTITYDVERTPGMMAIEVGPDRDLNGQAKLGNIFEYGTSRTPPIPHLNPALDHELPALEEHIGAALVEVTR